VPVSHGCVRLSRANATTLYALVEKEGVLNTTVTLTGSSQIALARNPQTRQANAAVRRNAQPGSDVGEPVAIAPQAAPGYQQGYQQGYQTQDPARYAPQYAPQQRPDDGYIYPADGSSDGARYPAPRSTRRLYDAQQGYPQPQPYYDNRGNYYAPQSPPPGYPQPYYQRGLFD
jgi:hypothetical protein